MRMRQAIGLSLALWAVSGFGLAKQAFSATDRDQQHTVKAKTGGGGHAAAKPAGARRRANEAALDARRTTAGRRRGAEAKPADRVIESRMAQSSALKVVGQKEVGIAAWYGGRHIGRRTASGALLDAVTPTAAHRSLPLNSLVRITNLRNGRSVLCTINDRGPWGANRLIDVSPRAADELDMKHSGIARVSVEPVVREEGGAD